MVAVGNKNNTELSPVSYVKVAQLHQLWIEIQIFFQEKIETNSIKSLIVLICRKITWN